MSVPPVEHLMGLAVFGLADLLGAQGADDFSGLGASGLVEDGQ
jgi:hypothetical protein